MSYQEFSGKSVEDALTNASITLGVTSSHLDYEVVERGSSGFLGFASKEAVIRVKTGDDGTEKNSKENDSETATDLSAGETTEKVAVVESEESSSADGSGEKPSESADVPSLDVENGKTKETYRTERKREPLTEEEKKELIGTAEDFLKKVFQEMELEVNIHSSFSEDGESLDIDLEGPEMGVIIGKRGQTLDSLQYLTSLVINRHRRNYTRVRLDTEDYRERRKETLENLAHNVAYKVKKTRRPVALESMNPYERRIIHAALSDDEYVTTHSEGEEPYRHVVVTLK